MSIISTLYCDMWLGAGEGGRGQMGEEESNPPTTCQPQPHANHFQPPPTNCQPPEASAHAPLCATWQGGGRLGRSIPRKVREGREKERYGEEEVSAWGEGGSKGT